MFLNNRYMDPATGVFISVDPMVAMTGEPYLYGSGSPTTLSDPSGLCSGREGGSGGCAVDNDDHRFRMVSNWVDVSRGLEFGGKTSKPFGGWSNGEKDAYGDLYLQADYLEKDHIAYQLAASGAPYWVVKAIFDSPDSYLEWTGGIGFNAYDYPTQSELASVTGMTQESLLFGVGRTSLAGQPAADTNNFDDVFHYTKGEFVDSISTNGLRPGSYATPNGGLSPLQAQIVLALPPNTGLRDAVMRVDVAGLRGAGYQIPAITRVTGTVTGPGGGVYTMPGGGYEMQFPYAIPPEFIKVVTP